MKIRNILALTLALLASSACGNNHLTSDQKGQLSDTMTSAGRATDAAQKQQQPAASLSSLVADTASAPNVDPMYARLQDAFNKKQCAVNTPSSPNSNDSGVSSGPGTSASSPIQVNVQVTGEHCPVVMDLEIGANGGTTSGKFDIAIKVNYQVKDTDYRALNDVDGMSIAGTISLAQTNVDMNISGKITSQKYGDIPIKVTGHMAVAGSAQNMSANGSMDATVQFPTFTADLRQEINGSQIKYLINDEEVSPDEFNGYFSKAGIKNTNLSGPGMGGAGPKS